MRFRRFFMVMLALLLVGVGVRFIRQSPDIQTAEKTPTTTPAVPASIAPTGQPAATASAPRAEAPEQTAEATTTTAQPAPTNLRPLPPGGLAAARQPGLRRRPPATAADVLAQAGPLTDPAVRAEVVAEIRKLEDQRREAAHAKARAEGWPIRIERDDGTVIELAYLEEDGTPRYRTTMNANAAISTGANLLNAAPYNYNGNGIAIGMWDGGAGRASHQEFTNGRMQVKDGAGSIDHATHVGGTMIAAGIQTSARGMANQAVVDSYDWTSYLAELTDRAAANAGSATDLYLSNHSWGYIGGWHYRDNDGTPARLWDWTGNGTGVTAIDEDFGVYNSAAREMDALVHAAPYHLSFWSAGNDRSENPSTGDAVSLTAGGSTVVSYNPAIHPAGDGVYRGGFDLVADQAVAKNVITIGAVNDAVSGGSREPNNASMSTFSSWGPTDDGRIKPDIVANGVGLYSPVNSSDTSYAISQGTSMSSPNAAGTAALLIEAYRARFPGQDMRASTLKGLIIHTADDLEPAGPDYKNGWGLMNGQAAVDLINQVADRALSARLTEDELTPGDPLHTYDLLWDGVSPIRATLTWTDPPALSTTTSDNRTSRLVNNLDVRIIGPDNTVYLPYVMPFVGTWTEASMSATATTGTNNTDNVEQVDIDAPTEPGLYRVEVSFQGSLDGNDPQAYALLVSGMDLSLDPNTYLRLEGDLDFGDVPLGESARRVVTLHNESSEAATITALTLPVGFSAAWTGELAAAASRDIIVTFTPINAASYSGNLELTVFGSTNMVSRPVTGAGIDAWAFAITNPSESIALPFTSNTLQLAGQAGPLLTSDFLWTNSASGSGSIAAATNWTINGIPLSLGTNLITVGASSQPVADRWAADSATNAAYSGGWTNNSNGGNGFHGWQLPTSSDNAGVFLATAGSNTNLDSGAIAWGLYANNAQEANVYRPFQRSLQSNDTFRMTFENNWITDNASVGLGLYNAAGEYLFQLYFVGGDSTYTINDATEGRNSGIGYTDTGLNLALTLTSDSAYALVANDTTITGDLAAHADQQPVRLRVWNYNAAGTAPNGGPYDLFINDLEIERGARAPVTVSDSIEVVRLDAPPEAPTNFWISLTNATEVVASWSDVAAAANYRLDVHTEADFISGPPPSQRYLPGYSNRLVLGTSATVTGLTANTTYYLRVRAENEIGPSPYVTNSVTTLAEERFNQTITFPAVDDQLATNTVTLQATASSGLPVSYFATLPGAITETNQLSFSGAGSVVITASQAGSDTWFPAPPVSQTITVSRANSVILTPPTASPITNGQSLAASTLSGGTANTTGSFTWVNDSFIPPAGVSTQAVRFTPDDTNRFSDTTGTVSIQAQTPILALDPVAPQTLTVTPGATGDLVYAVSNAGLAELTWSVQANTYDFVDDVETDAAAWYVYGLNPAWHRSTNRAVSGTTAWYNAPAGESVYAVNAEAYLELPPLHLHTNNPTLQFQHWMDAEILDSTTAWDGGLVQVTDAAGNTSIVGTTNQYTHAWYYNPNIPVFSGTFDWRKETIDLSSFAGQTVRIAFAFSSDPEITQEGWYIDDIAVSPNAPGADWITLSPTNGSLAAGASTSLTVNLSAAGLTNGATRQAVFTVTSNDPDTPSTDRDVRLEVEPLPATVTLSDLFHAYDGTPKTATASVVPTNLQVTITYDGNSVAPVDVGTYNVVARVRDPVYGGSTTGTLEIVSLTNAIAVSDSVGVTNDLVIDFGEQFVGDAVTATVTVHNVNATFDLTLTDIRMADTNTPISPSSTWLQTSLDTPASLAAQQAARRAAALASDAPRPPDQLIVKFKPGVTSLLERTRTHRSLGTQLQRSFSLIAADVVQTDSGEPLADLIAAYEAMPNVEYAEPNYIVSTAAAVPPPNDTRFGDLWGLHNTGQSGGTPDADIDALEAWAYTTGNSNVIVAVIDTGIDYNHPELSDNMWVNPDPDPLLNDIHGIRFISGNGQPTSGDPMDDQGHGTHVAGTIGAAGNNNLGIIGVNWNVQLMALKFITAANQGSIVDAIACIEYAVEHGAHLSNNSWGGGGYSQALQEAIAAAGRANQLFVVAAGNSGTNNDDLPFWPSNINEPNVIAVANSSRTDSRWSSSNYGVNSVHLAAPGAAIWSTLPNNSYASYTGTSMAAPHVAGTAALLLSRFPNAPYTDLRRWLLDSVDPLANWTSLVETGGRLNAANALHDAQFGVSLPSPLPITIPAGDSATLVVRYYPTQYGPFNDQLVIQHNDASQSNVVLQISGTGTSRPPQLTLRSAAQTATNGSGAVTLELDVTDSDSDAVDIALEYSTDNQATWQTNWISAVTASQGSVTASNLVATQLRNIVTTNGITNQLTITWSTTNHNPAIALSTNTVVRVRGSDGVVWSTPVLSEPFLVDNQIPLTPSNLVITPQRANVWTNNNQMQLTWIDQGDRDGIGVAFFAISFIDGTNTIRLTSTNTSAIATLPDSDSWVVEVQAVDAYGNGSSFAWAGPYRIDATPPSADAATLQIATSPYGNFTFGATLTNSWTGFTDALNSIAGYYISFSDGGGTTNGVATGTPTATLDAGVLDQTYTVYVWAEDSVGNIGPAISNSVMVLSPTGTLEGATMSNWEKNIAGIDASDPDSVFASETNSDRPMATMPSLFWPYASNRQYTIYWTDDALGPEMIWNAVPLTTNDFSIVDGEAAWEDTNPMSTNAARFYRINVSLPE
jgi:subtilisin family serine protease